MKQNRQAAPRSAAAKPALISLCVLCVLCGLCAKPWSASGQGRAPRGDGPAGPAGARRDGKVPKKREDRGPDVTALAKLYEARRFTTLDGLTMEYRLLRPHGYQAGKAYPMVVCLHGIPGEGRGNMLHLGATVPVDVLARPDLRKRYPAFVLAPQSPNWWGDEPYPGATPKRGRKHFPAMRVLLEMVGNLKRELGLDPNRIYVTGHGMGGFGTLNALKADPNMWAAAVVVSGGGDPNAAESFAHVPLWMFGGEKSPIFHYSMTMFRALKAARGTPKLTMLDDAPTMCWKQVYEADAVWDWLFSRRRQPPLPPLTTQPATGPATGPATPETKDKPKIIYTEGGVRKEFTPP